MSPALLLLVACDRGFDDPERAFAPPVEGPATYATTIVAPTTLGVVDTSRTDVHGTPIGVSCATCHGPDPSQAWAATPGEPFHTGVVLHHGNNTCDHCHDPADRTRLRLADGTAIEFGGAIQLCAQCHGKQYTNYQHGAHGGMNGYWDLRQGPRTRNHCVVCHAPHDPAIPVVSPVLPPHDRYLEAPDEHP